MALAELKIFSESLGIQTTVNVIYPQKSVIGEIGTNSVQSDAKPKCLYLLHGLSDDYSIWLRRTSIERYAQDRGICVIMPSGDRSFYTDMKHGLKYYTYISEELPGIIGAMFNVSDKREDNFIAGLSMGGYGALKIGMRNCSRFSKIAALSAVCDIKDGNRYFGSDMKNIFGEAVEVPDCEDLFAISKECNLCPDKPSVFMCVGKDDYLYKDNIRLKEHFEALDFDYTYMESDGDHNWSFWDKHIVYALDWMLKHTHI